MRSVASEMTRLAANKQHQRQLVEAIGISLSRRPLA
jgi:hypothetical protein